MSIVDEEAATHLRAIGKVLADAAGPGIGFAIFLASGHYLSNCERGPVMVAVKKWCRMSLAPAEGPPRRVREVPDLDDRVGELGRAISQAVPIVLFLFRGQDMAYFSSIDDAPALILKWLERKGHVPS